MPDLNTPEGLVAAGAEAASQTDDQVITDIAKGLLGSVKSEMLNEARRLNREAAEAVLAGKPEDAGTADPANVYGVDAVKHFQDILFGRKTVGGTSDPNIVTGKDTPLTSLGRLAAYNYHSNKNADMALEFAKKEGESERNLALMKGVGNYPMAVRKGMGIDDASAGGFLLEPEHHATLIDELLSETAIVSDPSILKVPMNGQLGINFIDTGSTGNWTAEGVGSNASQFETGQMTMTERQFSIYVVVSQKMLRSVASTAEFLKRAMKTNMATQVDLVALRSVGASNEMIGLRHKADSANLLNVNATVNAANVIEDTLRLQQALQDQNVPFTTETLRYAIAPRIWRFYMQLEHTSAAFIFQQEMLTMGSIFGAKIAGQSGRGISSIPTNLAVTDTNEAENYLYTTNGLIMGVGEDMTFAQSDVASYLDASGTHRSSFSEHNVVFKLVMSLDMAEVYRGKGIAIHIDCDWT